MCYSPGTLCGTFCLDDLGEWDVFEDAGRAGCGEFLQINKEMYCGSVSQQALAPAAAAADQGWN